MKENVYIRDPDANPDDDVVEPTEFAAAVSEMRKQLMHQRKNQERLRLFVPDSEPHEI